jgi:hypothetical protein
MDALSSRDAARMRAPTRAPAARRRGAERLHTSRVRSRAAARRGIGAGAGRTRGHERQTRRGSMTFRFRCLGRSSITGRMRPAITAAVALGALALPGAAEGAGTPCGALTDDGWRATDIRATRLTCRSARAKLRRWLPPPLPSNPYGWNCFPFRGRRMCAVGQGDAPRFTFRLRRFDSVGRAAASASAHPELHRACRQRVTYYIGVGHVRCRFAVRAVARMKRGGSKPLGWRCTGNRATRRRVGTCRSGGRVFHWIDGE